MWRLLLISSLCVACASPGGARPVLTPNPDLSAPWTDAELIEQYCETMGRDVPMVLHETPYEPWGISCVYSMPDQPALCDENGGREQRGLGDELLCVVDVRWEFAARWLRK